MGDVITPDRSRPTVHKHVQVREYVRGLIQGPSRAARPRPSVSSCTTSAWPG